MNPKSTTWYSLKPLTLELVVQNIELNLKIKRFLKTFPKLGTSESSIYRIHEIWTPQFFLNTWTQTTLMILTIVNVMGLYPLHEWTFCGLGILVHSFFFKSLPLILLLVAKSLGEYQYTFQGKTPARKYPFLCSSSPSLAKLSKGKKMSNQIPHLEEKLEPCFAKGNLVTLF